MSESKAMAVETMILMHGCLPGKCFELLLSGCVYIPFKASNLEAQ